MLLLSGFPCQEFNEKLAIRKLEKGLHWDPGRLALWFGTFHLKMVRNRFLLLTSHAVCSTWSWQPRLKRFTLGFSHLTPGQAGAKDPPWSVQQEGRLPLSGFLPRSWFLKSEQRTVPRSPSTPLPVSYFSRPPWFLTGTCIYLLESIYSNLFYCFYFC